MSGQLQLQQIDVNYGDFAAVKNVSIDVAQGDIACLLGPSGCGKTTVLRAIAGFEDLSGGEIVVNGAIISSHQFTLPPEKRKVGMVFQDFALFPHLSIQKNVGFGLGDLSQAARNTRIAELLDLVGLADYAGAFPHELSGGQQQRIALARAMAPNPNVMLLDEPFSNLDSELREQLATEVREILKNNNITSILVTHDEHEAFAMADQVTVMQGGEIAQSDTPFNLYHHPANAFVGGFIGQGALIQVTDPIRDTLLRQHPVLNNEAARLLVRPQNVQFDSASSLTLPVAEKSFRGANYLYELQLPDGQRILCVTPGNIDVTIGEALPVSLQFDNAVLFDAQGNTIS